MREVSKKNSIVGSWIETATFVDDGRVLTALTTFHDDGTIAVYDQGNVMVAISDAPSGVTGTVFSAGNGVWKQEGPPREFVYTQRELISDLSGNLIGFLHVRGAYTLSAAGDKYEGKSSFEVFDNTDENLLFQGRVTNAGTRIFLERER
jgi:hypothetical protein